MPLDADRLKAALRRLNFFDWLLWFGFGGWCLYGFFTGGHPLTGLLALPLLATGLLQLCAHRLAWHCGLLGWALCVAFVLALGFERGFSLWRGVSILGALWALWGHYRDRARFLALTSETDGAEENDGPKHSIVFLLGEPLYLDAALLGQIASRAYGVPFNDGEDSECFVVGGDNAPYMMRLRGAMFLVHNWPTPYFDDPAAVARDLRELRRATVMREHRAWLSVDFIPASADLPDDRIHDAIGRLLAEIADAGADILAVCHPATRRMEPWAPELRAKLAGGTPLSVFESDQVPVIRVDSGSSAMAAAVEEARRRWPEFLAAYQAAADKQPFSVKAPVSEAGNTEFIWINVKAISGDQIHGLLANDPVALGELKLGSFVSVSTADLNDWVCPDPAAPDRPLGLFTVKAVSAAGRA